MWKVALALGLTAIGFSAPQAKAQDTDDQRLGRVHFETSCNETAQRRFDRAMRYQHSFWYRESHELFEETLKADAECGIAYWGMALALWDNPHTGAEFAAGTRRNPEGASHRRQDAAGT